MKQGLVGRDKMPQVTIPRIRVVCGNKTCREVFDDGVIEFNFFTQQVVFVCPKCGHDSKIGLKPESQPLPRIRTR